LSRRTVQRRENQGGVRDVDAINRAAWEGTSGPSTTMPHQDAIQQSFGNHDVRGIEAHVGGKAAAATDAMGATAYASGNQVAFNSAPSLHTAAHEAAHVVQQRSGVSVSDGVGQQGDSYEQHADAVADKVVAGESAQPLLDGMSGGGASGSAVQQKVVQMEGGPGVAPLPPVNTTGAATSTFANPTLQDAVNAPKGPTAGTENRAANVKTVATASAPLSTPVASCPVPDLIYQESPQQTSPPPSGFTTVTGFNGTVNAPQVEQVMTDSLFIDGQPSPNDVQQGGIGDCYFMASLMSVAQQDPGKIRSMMAPAGHGGATVTFWTKSMSDPNWLKRLFGSKPEPVYQQVSITVNEQLAYNLATPLGSGLRQQQNAGNASTGFLTTGARLRAADHAKNNKWWSAIASNQLEVHRRDEYDTALWTVLLEKAFAAFTERYGQYGGSQANDKPAAGSSGMTAINGGWSHNLMFIFYGQQADMNGANQGNEQQQPTTWAPGSQVLAANPRVVDQLLLLQGRPANDTNAPIVTATSMVYLLIPRLQAAITAAQADPDWANITPAEQVNITTISTAIATYNALPNDAQGAPPTAPKATARRGIGTACSTTITVANAPSLLLPARSNTVKQMVELILDLKNIGTDNSPGQRNIFGDHVYSVVGVNFCTTQGTQVPLQGVPSAMRAQFFPLVDTGVSAITLRNPHHGNLPNATNAQDANGQGTGPEGPTDYPWAGAQNQSSGIFHMPLSSFFMNFTSVESGVFPKTGA
jgi:hypothetical protein